MRSSRHHHLGFLEEQGQASPEAAKRDKDRAVDAELAALREKLGKKK